MANVHIQVEGHKERRIPRAKMREDGARLSRNPIIKPQLCWSEQQQFNIAGVAEKDLREKPLFHKEFLMTRHHPLNHATWHCKHYVFFHTEVSEESDLRENQKNLGAVLHDLARRREGRIEEGL